MEEVDLWTYAEWINKPLIDMGILLIQFERRELEIANTPPYIQILYEYYM